MFRKMSVDFLKITLSLMVATVVIVLFLNRNVGEIRTRAANYFIKSSFIEQIYWKPNLVKNISIFCFIKTHPGNFKSRLPKSYNNCIKYCTDYRYFQLIKGLDLF